MPSVSSCAVVGHLYAPPEIKQNDRGAYCQVRFWTKDKVKGEAEAVFTSWAGFVNGPQAEWLRGGVKGSPIFVSGSVRLAKFAKADGTVSHTIEFTRVSEARLLERQEDGQQERPANAAPRATKPAPVHAPYDDGGIPF